MKQIIIAVVLAVAVYLGFSYVNANKNAEVQEELVTEEMNTEVIAEGEFSLNKEASYLNWTGKRIGATHEGSFGIQAASFNEDFTGTMVIDMASLTTDSDILINHLKGEDFFDVATYPTATFVATSYTEGMLNGTLTVRGTSKELSVPVTATLEGETMTLNATFGLDRTQWGITFRSSNFFADLGEAAIDDTVNVDARLVLERNG